MTPTEFNTAVAEVVATATAPKLNGHPQPKLVAMPEQGSYVAGKVFSPSQVNTFLTCPAKWMFKYLLDGKEPTDGPRHTGTCSHKVMEANTVHKLATKRDLDLPAAMDVFEKAWAEQEQVAWAPDDDPGELKAMGAKVVECYMNDVAPTIHPAAVETPVAGVIGGVNVRGKIDLMEETGTQGAEMLTRGADLLSITDLKTSARKAEPNAGQELQLTIYHLLTAPGAGAPVVTKPESTLIQITKTKEPRAIVWPVQITPAKIRYAQEIVPLVKDRIDSQLFEPRRDSPMCSRKYCGFWRACQVEFGGEVN